MNAPLHRAFEADASQGVVAHEIQVPSRGVRASVARQHRRRRRGRGESDRASHSHQTDRWMVSYADFISLLFAFFVVMYAMSSVNEGRYRVLSGALSTAFSPGDGSTQGAAGEQPRRPQVAPGTPVAVSVPGDPLATVATKTAPAPVAPAPTEPPVDTVDPVERAELARNAERVQHMQQLAATMDARLQSLVHDGQVTVSRGARGIAIEINAAVLFDPARAELKPASFESLRSLARVLDGIVEPLQIEGHSDDVPIATREFRSNWELSAARAASVGRFLIDQGIAPGRIGIAGYAEYRPLVGNVSAQTRARNRRVTLLILSADDARPKEGGASIDGSVAAPATP